MDIAQAYYKGQAISWISKTGITSQGKPVGIKKWGILSMDIFAQIAPNGIGGREELLHEPKPIKFNKKTVVLDRDITPLEVKKKISTKGWN